MVFWREYLIDFVMPGSTTTSPSPEIQEEVSIKERIVRSEGGTESRVDKLQRLFELLKKKSGKLGESVRKKFEEEVVKIIPAGSTEGPMDAFRRAVEQLNEKNLTQLRTLDRFLAVTLTKAEMRLEAAKGISKLSDAPAKDAVSEAFEKKLSECEDGLDANVENKEKYDEIRSHMKQVAEEFAGYGEMMEALKKLSLAADSFEKASNLADLTIAYARKDGKDDEFSYWFREKDGIPILYCFDKQKKRTQKFDPKNCFAHFGAAGKTIEGEKWGENAWVYVDVDPKTLGDRFKGEKLLSDEEKKLADDQKKALMTARTKILQDNYNKDDDYFDSKREWKKAWDLSSEKKKEAIVRQKKSLLYMSGSERGYYEFQERQKAIRDERTTLRDGALAEFENFYKSSHGKNGTQYVDAWRLVDERFERMLVPFIEKDKMPEKIYDDIELPKQKPFPFFYGYCDNSYEIQGGGPELEYVYQLNGALSGDGDTGYLEGKIITIPGTKDITKLLKTNETPFLRIFPNNTLKRQTSKPVDIEIIPSPSHLSPEVNDEGKKLVFKRNTEAPESVKDRVYELGTAGYYFTTVLDKDGHTAGITISKKLSGGAPNQVHHQESIGSFNFSLENRGVKFEPIEVDHGRYVVAEIPGRDKDGAIIVRVGDRRKTKIGLTEKVLHIVAQESQ